VGHRVVLWCQYLEVLVCVLKFACKLFLLEKHLGILAAVSGVVNVVSATMQCLPV